MAFVVGAIGVVVLHENYSRYNEHSNHSKYGDAEMRAKISNLQNQVENQRKEVNRFYDQIRYDYESRIDQLKREHGYSALYNSSRSNLVSSLRAEMSQELEASVSRDKRELDESIQRERSELEQINKMIDRINSIELNVKKKDLSDHAEGFLSKLDKMQKALDDFHRKLNERKDKLQSLLEKYLPYSYLPYYQELIRRLENEEFVRSEEKYFVVMIFGPVKAGKSTLGNFFAGKTFRAAPFDNPYKHIAPPKFKVHSEGRAEGSLASDAQGQQWFTVGFVNTTGSIQYFTLSGLRWVDSPGTDAVEKESDKVNMTALVNEYLSYTDMCIFLINSSEPGLQDDMKYMARLDKEGQEALIVITKSDFADEDVDDDGELIRVLMPKTPENRKLQEDDVRQRVKESYKVDERKFSMLSISTALANEAIAENDEEKFRASNLDKLMKILGDKINEETIERKQANPRWLFNTFVDEIIFDLNRLGRDDLRAELNALKF